jgi:hypothetical protein
MSDKMEKLIESFFANQENVFGVEQINLLIKETLLQEAVFSYEKLAEPKYFNGWIEKIRKEEPFILEIDGKKSEIVISKEFADVLESTKGNVEKLKTIFKPLGRYVPVIPASDGKKYAINQISKDIFTLKKKEGGIEGSSTADMKEGLASYFYSLGEEGISLAEKKIKSGSSEKINLPMSIVDNPSIIGDKASSLVKKAILHLNDSQISKEEKNLYLNAISAAKTIMNIQSGIVIDRGALFSKIRAVATEITSLEADKWCPGDVYVYKKEDVGEIERVLQNALETKTLVNISEGGKIIKLGINSLFDLEQPLIKAISLKEQDAQHGRATGFISIKRTTGEELAQGNFKLSEEEKDLLSTGKKQEKIKNQKKLIQKYEDEYESEKAKFEKLLKKSEYQIKEVKFISGKTKELPEDKKLLYLVSKSTCYRFMEYYLSNFDSLKKFNDVMAKYNNPLLALTAYGVSLSGFNPTFYKVQSSNKGDITKPSIFKGRDSLNMATEKIDVLDTMGKAGFLFQFITKMGEKNYTTTLDIRYAGTLNISVIVEEFKENA